METLVKICGITNLKDALAAAEAGADFLGYIFYAPSKRFIAPRSAGEIIRAVRAQFPPVQQVGVFVDDEAENVAWTRNLAGLDYVQLHGHESPDYCKGLTDLGIDIIKTVGIGASGPSLNPASYETAYYLCDTRDDKLKGGTGRQFDLEGLPESIDLAQLFIAGGLDPQNIADILQHVKPYAVDVSTGVEISPGIKSHDKVKSFIQNVRNVIPHHTTKRSN